MKESVGMRIRLARTRRRINQAELSRRIGISRNAMNLIEQDVSDPRFSRLCKIAEVLGVSLDYLSGRKDADSEMMPAAVALV